MSPATTESFDALTQASVAELLHEMAKNLARLEGCLYLSAAQDKHVSAARCHINEAVSEWIDEVMDNRSRSSSANSAVEPSTPQHPERALDSVLDMLAIYRDKVDQCDFTDAQFQRVMIAGFNLLIVARDIKKNAH
jgi:hypothetical protein